MILLTFCQQLEGGISHLPLLDPSMRAEPLAPSEWRNRLEAVNNTNSSSHENINPSCILLDVRNGKYSSVACYCIFGISLNALEMSYIWGWPD